MHLFLSLVRRQRLRISSATTQNIMVSDVGSEKDAISGLRAPTHYGRPNWDTIFSSIRDKHPSTECGVMFCGPKVRREGRANSLAGAILMARWCDIQAVSSTLHKMCNKWSSGGDDGTRFIYGKENF